MTPMKCRVTLEIEALIDGKVISNEEVCTLIRETFADYVPNVLFDNGEHVVLVEDFTLHVEML